MYCDHFFTKVFLQKRKKKMLHILETVFFIPGFLKGNEENSYQQQKKLKLAQFFLFYHSDSNMRIILLLFFRYRVRRPTAQFLYPSR